MTSRLNSLPKVNSVVISKSHDGVTAHLQEIQTSADKTKASVLYVSCKDFANQQVDLASAGLIKALLEQIMYRTRAGCLNPSAWFKYHNANGRFASIVASASELRTLEQTQGFLSHHYTAVKDQLQNLVEFEKRDFALVVITDFQEVPIDYQPIVAGLIHKLIKGTPMYFRILCLGEPTVFKRDTTGEVGIQRNHDYIEVRTN